MSKVCFETIWFSGRVQGVGFRYATLQAAKGFEVCGSVRNLSDGRVELSVEGAAGEIQALVAEMEERMHGYIKKIERSRPLRRAAQFEGFAIR